MWKWTIGIVLAVAFACLGGCDGADAGTPAGEGAGRKLKIVCTVGMVRDVVAEIVQDRAEVVGLMGVGVDPHSFKPTRVELSELQSADIVFYSGLMLEGKMGETLAKLGRQKPVYAVTDVLSRGELITPPDAHGEHDPHVWMDARLWGQVTIGIGQRLGEHDPANAAIYAERAAAYQKQCLDLFDYGKQVMATVPEQGRVLVTSHDAFSYFGRAYGIEVRGVQGISTEAEANIKDINHLVDMLVSRKVKAVFVESSVAPKNLQAVIEGARSRGHDVKVGGELYSDAMGPAGTYEGTYLGMIDHNITTVARALGGSAPVRGWQGKLSHDAP